MFNVKDAPWIRNPDCDYLAAIECDECGKLIQDGEEYIDMDTLGCFCPACAEYLLDKWRKVL